MTWVIRFVVPLEIYLIFVFDVLWELDRSWGVFGSLLSHISCSVAKSGRRKRSILSPLIIINKWLRTIWVSRAQAVFNKLAINPTSNPIWTSHNLSLSIHPAHISPTSNPFGAETASCAYIEDT